MRIAITGSIATDHLMAFPGRFAEQLMPDQLATVSLSFLVDDLEVRRGGVAANIALGLARLGLAPVLVGAVGPDFGEYGDWLRGQGVDTASVRYSETRQTARFMCTTDLDRNQIASFYAGAMAEAREIELAPTAARLGGLDLVLVSPNDPTAMVRHTEECRALGRPFAADPGQQIARMDGADLLRLVDDAWVLFTNEYEAALLTKHTGRTHDELLDSVGTWITTLGAEGIRIERSGAAPVLVPAVPVADPVEPTGLGDAFRAGFLAAVSWGLEMPRAAQLGCALAAVTLRQIGPQGDAPDLPALLDSIRRTYGEEAAAELAPHLAAVPSPGGAR
ncbi:ribokinase [Kitasatospora sp. MMS16-BH015]|uniref:carbohydrate kinase family protein n=1 Tax=Kitasatospora sp. MMS16-BH015 TaxID=2018025 RepID=UPI000CA0FD9E|nr:carbohydrate kinase family protein [Kitasatospora sp. MMS16-BH015]AUG80691.1 ribokinase [Kitasatospora sp. MMS16-BH015]